MTEPKRGRGRPPVAAADQRATFSVRLPKPMLDEFRAEADRRGLIVTEAFEQAVAEWLAASKDGPHG